MINLQIQNKAVPLHPQFGLEYASGGRVVAGSNPVTPTGENEGVKRLLSSFFLLYTDGLLTVGVENKGVSPKTRVRETTMHEPLCPDAYN